MKSRYQQSRDRSGGSRTDSISLPVSASRGPCIPRSQPLPPSSRVTASKLPKTLTSISVCPSASIITAPSSRCSSSLSLIKDPRDDVGPTHPGPSSRSSTEQSLLPHKVTYPVSGYENVTIFGGGKELIFCLPQRQETFSTSNSLWAR